MASVWILVALAALTILQVPFATGPAMETFGAGFVAGWLAQLYLLSLIVDVARGILPLPAVLIPVLFYSGYYAAYWQQGIHARLKSVELRQANPEKLINFNSQAYSLVIDHPEIFVATHDIPVAYAYSSNFRPEVFLSYRLLPKNRIADYSNRYELNRHEHYSLMSVYWDGILLPNVAVLQAAERPPQPVISVKIRDEPGTGWKEWNIGEQTTSLQQGGRTIGVFKAAYIQRLPVLPFFTIGCKFSADPPNRNCGLALLTERMLIESRPDHVNHLLYGDPVSIMLGIKELSRDDIVNYHESTVVDVSNIPNVRVAEGEDAAFEALAEVVEGRNPQLSWMTSYLIANSPARLGPLADGMVKRLADLSRNDNSAPDQHKQRALLASGILALRPSDFVGVEDQLINLARRSSLREEYPLLYLRLADAGPSMFSAYRDQFMAPEATTLQKLLSALAICRLGQADTELIAALKSEWSSAEVDDDNYKATLFVTLVKLGQADALRSASRSSSKALQSWYDAIFAGRGKTSVGPNNCMPMEWPGNDYVPPVLAPSLRWAQNEWISTD
jgi:hypothetical protein